ncbi:hypothetical protein [Actinocatenispora comari]|uniref:Uncharacterized protein n=1 Tax=Actinocatenispora comari TaxID=2807577 RepID=A0A8J4AEE6_9ACTN|nr:hypothetical protein [Actinocatenispora comari]GIL29059.1 hypothetical protein NUM_43130 [Actinocatenispora comari]
MTTAPTSAAPDAAGIASARPPHVAGGITPTKRLIIAGCTNRKSVQRGPLPALDRYQGGCVPELRNRLGYRPQRRARIRFLSAEHGLIAADTPLVWYDRRLDPARAAFLRPAVTRALAAEFAAGVPDEVLVIAEPVYLVLLADLLAHPGRPRIRWIPDPHGWPQAAAVLTDWGW